MRILFLAIVVVAIASCRASEAPATISPPAPHASLPAVANEAAADAAIEAGNDAGISRDAGAASSETEWIDQRIARARSGAPESIELTVWKCWGGCTCAGECLFASADEEHSFPVDVKLPHGGHLRLTDDASEVLIGHFSGEAPMVHDLGETEIPAHPLYEFVETRVVAKTRKSGWASTGSIPPAEILDAGL